MTVKKPLYDVIICLCVLVFIGGFALQAAPIPKDARGYPIFLICASALLTTALLVRAARALRTGEQIDTSGDFKRNILTIVAYSVLIGAYVLLLDKISYVVATILFVVASLLFLKVRSWKLLVLLPLGLTFSMYFLFTKFLLVTLPRGTWFTIGL